MTTNDYYAAKESNYFTTARDEILPLLPDSCGDVLEIGCGNGSTMAWLRSKRQIRRAVGIELMPDQAVQARSAFDEVTAGDIEEQDLPEGRFHLILALDVLEHLTDPWMMVQRFHNALRPGGSLVVSLPNVGHYSVAIPLLLFNRWTYQPSGLLDQTHLRFFTRQTATDLVTCSGLHLTAIRPRRPMTASRLLTKSARWYLRRIMEALPLPPQFDYQYLIRATAP